MPDTKIRIVILNYKGFQDLKECIDSIDFENHQLEVLIIDNASGQEEVGLLKALQQQHPQLRLMLNDNNLGFARAYNAFFRSLDLEKEQGYVFLLNNDTSFHKDTLFKMGEVLKTAGPRDMISSRMINYYDHRKMDNAGHIILSSGEILPRGHGENVCHYDRESENIGACGGACLYPLSMLADIGFFDEYFITGYEDAEIGLRAFIAGYDCVYNPDIKIFHKMGSSIKKVFDYHFALKTQCNIVYTYFKLLHWQVILINFLPNLLRFLFINIISILSLRFVYLKILYQSYHIVYFKELGNTIKARREAKKYRRIPWWKMLKKQQFFLFYDIKRFSTIIFGKRHSYFDLNEPK